MINREIVYERNLTGSFMKIAAGIHAGLDEKLMLRRKLPGLLAVEKAYMDGEGQYWYNISGKQSLDMYCRVKEVDISFIEKLIMSICSEMEILEWNLIQTNCLMLDPELIFITNSNQEIIFTVYPGGSGTIETEFQQLMEFLLTKVDHKDTRAVKAAYGIYEKTLLDGYSITDIRDEIVRTRQNEGKKAAVEESGGNGMEKVVLPAQKPRRTEEEVIAQCPWAATGKAKGRKPNIITSLELKPEAMEINNLRFQAKYREIEKNEVRFEEINCEDAEYLIIAFGSMARIGQKAMELAREKGIKVGILRPITLWPFPTKAIAAYADKVKGMLVTELNAGQMIEDVRLAVNGKVKVEHFGRLGGIVPDPDEIVTALEEKIIK